jgi:hypothetical protein
MNPFTLAVFGLALPIVALGIYCGRTRQSRPFFLGLIPFWIAASVAVQMWVAVDSKLPLWHDAVFFFGIMALPIAIYAILPGVLELSPKGSGPVSILVAVAVATVAAAALQYAVLFFIAMAHDT